MNALRLHDLDESLPEAQAVIWPVHENDRVEVDQPRVSVDNTKAVVGVGDVRRGRNLT